MSTRRVSGMGLAAVVLALMAGGREAAALQAPAGQSSAITERTVWYFYKVRWGFQEEFVTLFKKNHLPVLRAQQEAGRMSAVRAFAPSGRPALVWNQLPPPSIVFTTPCDPAAT